MTKVTHFVYDGMLLHVALPRAAVLEVLNHADHLAESTFVTLPVMKHDNKPQDITFSLMGSIMVMDEHEWVEPKTGALSGFEPPSVTL